MERVDFGWDDFWAETFRVKYRSTIPGIQQYDEIVVDFCLECLGLKEGKSLLDIACGDNILTQKIGDCVRHSCFNNIVYLQPY